MLMLPRQNARNAASCRSAVCLFIFCLPSFLICFFSLSSLSSQRQKQTLSHRVQDMSGIETLFAPKNLPESTELLFVLFFCFFPTQK